MVLGGDPQAADPLIVMTSRFSRDYKLKEAVMSKLLQKREETNPFAFMRRITDELDRAFAGGPELPALIPFYSRVWAPELEVFERENKFFVRVDLPGLKKED